jgi:hypothetical protein
VTSSIQGASGAGLPAAGWSAMFGVPRPVVRMRAGGQPGTVPPGGASSGGSGQAAAPEGKAVQPVEEATAVDPAGDEEGDDALPQTPAAADEGFDPAIEERLRQLDLHRRTDDEAWGGPIADRALPDLPGSVCDCVDAFWQAGFEGLGQAEGDLALLPHPHEGSPSQTSTHARLDGSGPDSRAKDAAAVWLDWPEPGASRPVEALLPRPGLDDLAREVVVMGRDWRWEVPVLAALAAGGLYLAGVRPVPGGPMSRVRARRPRLRAGDGR